MLEFTLTSVDETRVGGSFNFPGIRCFASPALPSLVENEPVMFRAFFLALGLSTFILGLECLVIDKAVLKPRSGSVVEQAAVSYREVQPPEWAPWSLLSGGAVVMLYSFTIPAKMRG